MAGAAKRCVPSDFLFGSATASYQVEGGWNETGRTPSIWDSYCRATPGVECANVADDFIHRYKQDIDLMVETGLQTFRFSVSWSRVMNWDAASKRMKPNPPGIAFYHDVIDTLKAKGVTPIMTLYHWDLPSELHTELSPQGWLNREIVEHFVAYAELMYTEYGSKVDFWSTFNEPTSFVISGDGTGVHATAMPQSTTNTYIVAPYILLSHAYAVQRFRALKNKLLIPAGSYQRHRRRDCRAQDGVHVRLVLAPDRVRRIPRGDAGTCGRPPTSVYHRGSDAAQGSYDLFLFNHYHSKAVTDCTSPASSIDCSKLSLGWEQDHGVDNTRRPAGAKQSSTGPNGEYLCPWLLAYPQGYSDTIRWMHKHDPQASILLTENGWCGNATIDNPDQMWYFQKFLEQVHIVVDQDKIPVIGYTAWSCLDNYERGSFKPRFGLYYVNFTSHTGSKDSWMPKPEELARIPRPVAKWYAELAKTKCMEIDAV